MAVSKTDKWKFKKWYTIIASRHFNSKEVGETPALDEKQLLQRKVWVNLFDLTGNSINRNADVRFSIVKIDGLKAYTVLDAYELRRSYASRLVRKRREKIELICFPNTKDGRKIKVTAWAIAAGKPTKTLEKKIRKKMLDVITDYARKKEAEEFIYDVAMRKLNELIKQEISKLYPIEKNEIVKVYIKK